MASPNIFSKMIQSVKEKSNYVLNFFKQKAQGSSTTKQSSALSSNETTNNNSGTALQKNPFVISASANSVNSTGITLQKSIDTNQPTASLEPPSLLLGETLRELKAVHRKSLDLINNAQIFQPSRRESTSTVWLSEKLCQDLDKFLEDSKKYLRKQLGSSTEKPFFVILKELPENVRLALSSKSEEISNNPKTSLESLKKIITSNEESLKNIQKKSKELADEIEKEFENKEFENERVKIEKLRNLRTENPRFGNLSEADQRFENLSFLKNWLKQLESSISYLRKGLLDVKTLSGIDAAHTERASNLTVEIKPNKEANKDLDFYAMSPTSTLLLSPGLSAYSGTTLASSPRRAHFSEADNVIHIIPATNAKNNPGQRESDAMHKPSDVQTEHVRGNIRDPANSAVGKSPINNIDNPTAGRPPIRGEVIVTFTPMKEALRIHADNMLAADRVATTNPHSAYSLPKNGSSVSFNSRGNNGGQDAKSGEHSPQRKSKGRGGR